MKVVRDSKFRHVHGEAQKEKYEDLRVSTRQVESTGVRGNGKFIAFPWESGGGGSMAVIPVGNHGRTPRDLPLITGHSAGILDFEFNPFNDHMMITASEDAKMMLWDIPEGGYKTHAREPFAELKCHEKKVVFSTFNPVANGVVASSSFDFTTKVSNVSEQEELFSINMPETGVVNHLKWNMTGSLLAASCKDKKLRIIDPRQSKFAIVAKIHEGSKPMKLEWLGGWGGITDETHKIVSTGFTRDAGREINIWDIRMLEDTEDVCEPLNNLAVDPGTGALFPFFDPGCQMLYVAGKGDGSIRYFEASAEDPYLHFIDVFSSTTAQKGVEFLPKRVCDVSKHEVGRCMKVEPTHISYISFKVPRKSKEFQDDLFPDCPCGAPSMTSEEWAGGADQRMPLMGSMKPGAENAGSQKQGAPAAVSVKDLKKQLAEAQAKIQALEQENKALKEELTALKK